MATNAWTAWARLWSSGLRMAQTGVRMTETMHASGEVIDSRVRTMAEAVINPLGGDYGELGRMIPEKVDAFGRAGANAFGDLIAMQSAALANCQQLASLALAGRAPTLAEAEAMWARSFGIAERAMDSTGRALAPLHKRATANARRLRRTAR
ncbi:MAG TPA: hypothetical protein VGC10_04765 [Sphingomonas sp.]